jgi:putative PEP-CTERM system TPR-repeat lipoprotein
VQLQGKQIEAARANFQRALETNPGDPGAANNLASLALLDGDTGEAIRQYESILEHRPDHMRTVVKLGRLLVSLKRFDEAQALYEARVEAHPDAVDPRVLLAEIHMLQGQPGRALALLRAAPESVTDHPAYLAVLGKGQLAAGELASAIHSLERLIKVRPRYLPAHDMLAGAYARQGNLGKLEASLDQALAIRPGHLPARLGMLKLLVQQKRVGEAAELLAALKADYPELPELYIQEALLAQADGRPEAVVAAYREAMKRAPRTELVSDLALAQWKAGQPEAGLQTLKDWLAGHPDDLVVRYNLANLYMATGRHAEARVAFTTVVEARPKHVLALTNLALLSRDSDPGKAYDYAKRAHELAPDAPVVQDALAQIHLDRDEGTQALRLLETAVEKSPQDLQIRFHWAQALARNGEKEKARRELTRILAEGRRFAGESKARSLLEELGPGQG